MNSASRINKAKSVLKQLTDMKTIPAVATRLISMLEDENTSFQEFEEVIEIDHLRNLIVIDALKYLFSKDSQTAVCKYSSWNCQGSS